MLHYYVPKNGNIAKNTFLLLAKWRLAEAWSVYNRQHFIRQWICTGKLALFYNYLIKEYKKYCIIISKYLRVTETSCTFAPRTRRGARVVEEARLESVYTPKGYHEFESRSLRTFCII